MARLSVKQGRALDDAHETAVDRFARFGYLAKGVTYLLMGLFALRAALGSGHAANTTRAISSLDGGPIGRVTLVIIGTGLVAYALWKMYEAFANPEDDGWNLRIGAIAIGLVNGAIGVEAIRLAMSAARGNADRDDARHWSGVVMQYPLGVWAVGAAGLGVAGYGLWQIYRGVRSKLDSQLRLGRMDHERRGPAVIASRFGIVARGFVFVLIGMFVTQAALQSDPSEARDFGHSLELLRAQPFGAWMLGIVAAGLFAYAVYEFLRAKYRNVPTA